MSRCYTDGISNGATRIGFGDWKIEILEKKKLKLSSSRKIQMFFIVNKISKAGFSLILSLKKYLDL